MSMSNKLFGRTNPNNLIFQLEEETGNTDILDPDTYHASIGDSTMEHVDSLTNLERLAHDEYICMPDGNLFRMEENWHWLNEDEYNLHDKSELKMFLDRHNVPEKDRECYDDEVIQELEKRNSEDLMTAQREMLIPYGQWEQFPQMSKHWETPAVPKPKSIFVGNCRQGFYDYFPEDHPLASILDRLIRTLDRFEKHQLFINEEEVEEAFPEDQVEPTERDEVLLVHGVGEILLLDCFKKSLWRSIFRKPKKHETQLQKLSHNLKVSTYVRIKDYLEQVHELHDPGEGLITLLTEVDREWWTEWKNTEYRKLCKHTAQNDPLYVFLIRTEKKYLHLAKWGYQVDNRIKRLGRKLFKYGFQHNDGKTYYMRKHHWSRYRTLRDACQRAQKYRQRSAPQPERTVISTEYKRSILEQAKERLLALRQKAIQQKNPRIYTDASRKMIAAQQKKEVDLGPQDWQHLWNFYHENKTQVLAARFG